MQLKVSSLLLELIDNHPLKNDSAFKMMTSVCQPVVYVSTPKGVLNISKGVRYPIDNSICNICLMADVGVSEYGMIPKLLF